MLLRILYRVGLLSVFVAFATVASAQKLTGIWRGYFITDNGEQYKYEVQIDQSASKRLTGVTYSYLDTRFYGKATFTGNFNTVGKNALVEEIKTVELRMSGNSAACIMKCQVIYSRSGNEEFLEGIYSSIFEKSDSLTGIERGGNCGGGKLFLRKVPTSDFYVEPFLRTKPKQDPPTEVIAKQTPKKPVTTPAKPPVVTNKKPPVATTKKPVVKEQKAPVAIDSVQRTTNIPVVKTPMTKQAEAPMVKLPAVTRSRTNELVQTFTLTNSDVQVKLYDNGEIDDDTISVYLDNKLVLSSKRLSAAPLSISIKMDRPGEEHVLVMVAENLGRIPPNTSLMIVNDGDRRYEVRVTSTEQKNAMIRFRYQATE